MLAPPPDLLTDGSEPMGALLRDLATFGPAPLPVLVLGPTGSGKELVARELHRRSGRPGPLVPVNCAALDEGTLLSELFGHVRGAFTGADRDRPGAFACAAGGSLFLDEAGDLPPRLQALLLRALQDGEVRPVGGDRPVRVDVRVLAATHQPLERLAAAGAFRPDLLYRLSGCVLRVPSLAARRHEFPFLVPALAAQVALGLGRPAPVLAPGLAQALAALPWPGNVRELKHCLARAILRCPDGPVTARQVPELAGAPAVAAGLREATRGFQRERLLQALESHGFVAARAARELGLSRTALYAAARRLGIDLAIERARGS